MTTIFLIAGWFACAALAFRLFVFAWLCDFSTVTLGDAIFFAILSLGGPLAVIISGPLSLMAWAETHVGKNPPIVLWRRK